MEIGKLNRRIVIQKRDMIEDENGFEVEIWDDYKTVWSNIKNINGKEYFLAQQVQSKASKKATIRYIKDIDQSINLNSSLDYRVKYNENIYNILYFDNIKEQNKFIELLLEG